MSLLSGFSPSREYYDAFGGWTAASAPATGFFHTTNINHRWWMVDPLGNLYLQKGLGGVNPGASATEQAALQSVYGNVATWATRTLSLLRMRGFNETGAASDDTDLQRPSSRLPWTETLGMMENFGASIGRTPLISGTPSIRTTASSSSTRAFPLSVIPSPRPMSPNTALTAFWSATSLTMKCLSSSNWAGADASNTDSNKGIVTTTFKEYTDYTSLIQGVNRQCYNLTYWFDGP